MVPIQIQKGSEMTDLQQLKATLLADGILGDHEVEIIRQELYADGKIDKDEVEFLLSLRNEAEIVCPAFEGFFFEAVKQNVLADGSIGAKQAEWLRRMLFGDGKFDARERKFMGELRHQVERVSPEFQHLYDECMSGSDLAGEKT
jgi:hypothetical protein